MRQKQYTAFLHLEDGRTYKGWSFSSSFQSIGEVIFNTGMTGYQEILTDPSYYKQIILFTYPEIGNTGINLIDMESDSSTISGVIARNFCKKPSNWRNSLSIVDYLIANKIPHIFGIDTRFLTKKIRKKGVMAGCISTKELGDKELNLAIKSLKSLPLHPVKYVSTKKKYYWQQKTFNFLDYSSYLQKVKLNYCPKVVVIDYGVKFNILNRLVSQGCDVVVVPASTSYKSILALEPDGILLSNGPGDPSLLEEDIVNNIKYLVSYNIPIFGICLGHQLLSLAVGAKTHKLKFGHRGLNHPSGSYDLVRMTSQNHGYVVSSNTLPSHLIHICSLNCNDKTIAGIVHKDKPCFSVQYHPEASPGPHDSDFLFLHFIQVMLSCNN